MSIYKQFPPCSSNPSSVAPTLSDSGSLLEKSGLDWDLWLNGKNIPITNNIPTLSQLKNNANARNWGIPATGGIMPPRQAQAYNEALLLRGDVSTQELREAIAKDTINVMGLHWTNRKIRVLLTTTCLSIMAAATILYLFFK